MWGEVFQGGDFQGIVEISSPEFGGAQELVDLCSSGIGVGRSPLPQSFEQSVWYVLKSSPALPPWLKHAATASQDPFCSISMSAASGERQSKGERPLTSQSHRALPSAQVRGFVPPATYDKRALAPAVGTEASSQCEFASPSAIILHKQREAPRALWLSGQHP